MSLQDTKCRFNTKALLQSIKPCVILSVFLMYLISVSYTHLDVYKRQAIFILFCATLVIVTIIQNPRDAGIGLALVLMGIPFFRNWNNKIKKELPPVDVIP